eukprot:3941201-Rhodomonas_salina.5
MSVLRAFYAMSGSGIRGAFRCSILTYMIFAMPGTILCGVWYRITLAPPVLRFCYAMSGTDIDYAPTRWYWATELRASITPFYPVGAVCYALPGTDIALSVASWAPVRLIRACYAMSGTEIAYGAVPAYNCGACGGREGGYCLECYALSGYAATRPNARMLARLVNEPVVRDRSATLSAYALAMRPPVLTWHNVHCPGITCQPAAGSRHPRPCRHCGILFPTQYQRRRCFRDRVVPVWCMLLVPRGTDKRSILLVLNCTDVRTMLRVPNGTAIRAWVVVLHGTDVRVMLLPGGEARYYRGHRRGTKRRYAPTLALPDARVWQLFDLEDFPETHKEELAMAQAAKSKTILRVPGTNCTGLVAAVDCALLDQMLSWYRLDSNGASVSVISRYLVLRSPYAESTTLTWKFCETARYRGSVCTKRAGNTRPPDFPFGPTLSLGSVRYSESVWCYQERCHRFLLAGYPTPYPPTTLLRGVRLCCCAMSGNDIGYAPTSHVRTTEQAMLLHVSSTEMRYAATRSTEMRYADTGSLVLRCAMCYQALRHVKTRSGSTLAIAQRACYAMSGTELAYVVMDFCLSSAACARRYITVYAATLSA